MAGFSDYLENKVLEHVFETVLIQHHQLYMRLYLP